jgi:hypothetical protein
MNTSGLILSFVGVILLFRYGMPYRVPQINEGSLWADGPTEKDKTLNRRHLRLGFLGLVLIAGGTALQVWGAN